MLTEPVISSPIIVSRLSWRYIYWITASVGVFAWGMLIFFVPESRYLRSDAELGKATLVSAFRNLSMILETSVLTSSFTAGQSLVPLPPGENRPRLDVEKYGPRTRKTELGVFNVSFEWAIARRSIWDTIKTTFFPNMLWAIIVNSLLISTQGAAGQVASTILIAAGWNFERLGLAVIPIVIASPFVWLFGGYLADRVSNWHAKRNGGVREPEAHLLSLILPLCCAIMGPILFGYAGDNIGSVSIYVLLLGIAFIGFSALTTATLFAVYMVESYPAFAG